MTIQAFPPIELADEHGLLAIGGDLEISSLLLAYRSGIFPWPLDQRSLTWFAPPCRAVLFLKDLHISKSLRKEILCSDLNFRIDDDIAAVISGCMELKNRGTQDGTWITPKIRQAYIKLHQAGFCHSVGSYLHNSLVGGLYGVSIGRMFAGESMFFRKPNSSKLALWFVLDLLNRQEVPWIDCQVMTPLLKSFGAREIPRLEFMEMLAEAIKGPEIKWGPL